VSRPKAVGQARPGRPGFDRPPWFLGLVALAWLAAGAVELTVPRASFHVPAGVVFIGVGLLWGRGALVGLLRRQGVDVPAPGGGRGSTRG
jgi:hypothetical protein